MPANQLPIFLAVLAGTAFLVFSLYLHLTASCQIPEETRPKWRLMAGLMGFFVAGYLFFLVIQLQQVSFPLELLTSAVFGGGGLFVFLVTRLTLKALAQITANERELRRINEQLLLAYDSTLEGWSHALELRDKETQGHTQRVVQLTRAIAEKFGIEGEQMVHLTRGALLHDIGKMAIPDTILMNKGPLTDQERLQMQQHPVYALEMLSPIAYLKPALEIPYAHHEHWDGTGYPRGLKGEEIPLAARIFAVADAWDALVNARRYHEAWPQEKACRYIADQSGSHFDPAVVRIFQEMEWCRDADQKIRAPGLKA